MKLTFLLATRNPHKGKELGRLLKNGSIRILTLDCFPDIPPVRENAQTFKANAAKKAVQTSRHTILPVLADDSGLEVRALGGKPGVYSARFAGKAQDAFKNNTKLLRLLKKIPASGRQARFVCCIALAVGGRIVKAFKGSCSGKIALAPRGKTGFGYDPVFIPQGYQQTFAQLGKSVKDRLSHRGKAIRQLRRYLEKRSLIRS